MSRVAASSGVNQCITLSYTISTLLMLECINLNVTNISSEVSQLQLISKCCVR
jgi:hypothetical protein